MATDSRLHRKAKRYTVVEHFPYRIFQQRWRDGKLETAKTKKRRVADSRRRPKTETRQAIAWRAQKADAASESDLQKQTGGRQEMGCTGANERSAVRSGPARRKKQRRISGDAKIKNDGQDRDAKNVGPPVGIGHVSIFSFCRRCFTSAVRCCATRGCLFAAVRIGPGKANVLTGGCKTRGGTGGRKEEIRGQR